MTGWKQHLSEVSVPSILSENSSSWKELGCLDTVGESLWSHREWRGMQISPRQAWGGRSTGPSRSRELSTCLRWLLDGPSKKDIRLWGRFSCLDWWIDSVVHVFLLLLVCFMFWHLGPCWLEWDCPSKVQLILIPSEQLTWHIQTNQSRVPTHTLCYLFCWALTLQANDSALSSYQGLDGDNSVQPWSLRVWWNSSG